MSRNVKLKSVSRIKKRFPRPDLAHLDKSASEPETKTTIKKVSTPPPRPVSQAKPVDAGSPKVRSPEAGSCVSADRHQCSESAAHEPLPGTSTLAAPADKADASTFIKSEPSQESSSGIPVEPLADTDESASGQAGSLVQRKLKRLSLPELQRYAKQSAKGADNAILEHAGLSSLLGKKLAEIKDTKTPKDASEDVRAAYNEKRAQLRKERDAISRKKTISYENAVALERAADEYAAVVAMLLDRPEVDYRRQPRLHEKHIDLTDEEKLALIERFLSSGRFSKHDAPASTSEDAQPASPVADTDGGSDDNGGKRGRGMLYALLLLFAVIILVLMWFCTSKKTSTDVSSLTAVSSTATTTISSSSTEIQGTIPTLGVQTITQDEQIAVEPNEKSVAPAPVSESVAELTAGVGATAPASMGTKPISESTGEGVGPTIKATVVSLSEPTVQAVPALEKAVPDSPVFSSEPIEKEVSVSETVDRMGEAVAVRSYDGFAEVSFPSSITTKEVSSFLIHEYALYADFLSEVSYTFISPGLVRIDYPVGISVADRRYAVDRFCKDLIAYTEGSAVASTPVSMREDMEGEPSVIASGLTDHADAERISPKEDLPTAAVVAALPASGEASSTVEVPADAVAKTNILKLTVFTDNEAAGTSPFASGVPVDRTGEDGVIPIAVEATAEAVAGPEASSGQSGSREPGQVVVLPPVVFSERQPAVTELEPAVAVAVPTDEPVSQSVETDKSTSLLTIWGAPFSFKAVDILSSNYAYYSSYGAGSGLSYDYRFPTGTTLGLDIGFLWHKISSSPYYDIPVIARFGYRWEGSKWSFGMMFGAGVMIARYEGVTQYSLLCATSMELHRWMTEKLGLSLRLTGLMSENSLLPSVGSNAMISYELPVFLGLTFRF